MRVQRRVGIGPGGVGAPTYAIHNVFLLAMVVLLAGFALVWRLKELPLKETVQVGDDSADEPVLVAEAL